MSNITPHEIKQEFMKSKMGIVGITILSILIITSVIAIITEAVFDWPGMGRLYFEAITVMDLPVIIGATYLLTVFFLISIFIADLLYGYFDPRIRTNTE